ncbi:MAG: CoA transferase [Flavobacteriales bacterium]|nr:CoA transferase [Flavobacteriales bacterium]
MLSHLKIVELASVLAGPSVGMFFAELGAKVIKIENKKTGGDVTRSWKLPHEESDKTVSAYFSSVNYGKEYMQVDLQNEHDLKRIHELIAGSDMVIANFKAGDAEKYQLDYESLKKINPALIYGSITGFGENDARPAFDVVLQAESGFMSMNGTPDSGPLKMPVALIDVLAAHQLKEALLLALLKREKSGEGSSVSVSLYAAAVSSLINQATNYLMGNHIPQRQGSLHPNIAPYGETFITADKKFIVLAIGSDAQFKKLCDVLGDPSIAMKKMYKSNTARVENRKRLYSDLSPLFFQYHRSDLMKWFIEQQIPAGAVNSIDEVFAQSAAQSLLLRETIDGVETCRVSSLAFDPKRVL